MNTPIIVTLANGETIPMPAPRTTGTAVKGIPARDWQRMSWHQRQQWLHRYASIHRPIDTAATEEASDRRTLAQRQADDFDELLRLIQSGASPADVIEQIGPNARAIERRLDRRGFHAEASMFRSTEWDRCECGARKWVKSRMCKHCGSRRGGLAAAARRKAA